MLLRLVDRLISSKRGSAAIPEAKPHVVVSRVDCVLTDQEVQPREHAYIDLRLATFDRAKQPTGRTRRRGAVLQHEVVSAIVSNGQRVQISEWVNVSAPVASKDP